TTSLEVWLSLERAYTPHTSSREYTLKTQLLKLEMKGDETSDAYLNQAKEYADALGNIGEAFKEKYLVMLLIVGLHEDYNGLKSTLLARQAPTAFHELQGLLADHDYMIKQYVPAIPS
ncbi:nucleotide-binding alpha-beta plait domain-containing protein, partial [Tanacetum coccineum]